MADIIPGGEQYETIEGPTRQAGIDKLKRHMGGDAPRAATPREARMDQNLDLADTLITDRKVPRRPAPGTAGQSGP